MKHERQVGQRIDHVREGRGRIEHLALVVGSKYGRPGVENAVTQPRAVAHQMTNGDRSARGLRIVQRGRAGPENTAIRELRYEPLDRVVELESAFLKEEQRGAGGDQLGVGENAKQMVDAHRDVLLLVGPPDTVQVYQISPHEDGGGNARENIRVHVPAHGGVDGTEVVAIGYHCRVFHRVTSPYAGSTCADFRYRGTVWPNTFEFSGRRRRAAGTKCWASFRADLPSLKLNIGRRQCPTAAG